VKNMNKKFLLGLATIGILGVTVIPSIANAYQGDPNTKGPNYSEERHVAMEKAFENKDYGSWKTLMNGKGRVTQVVNEKNFAKFAEAHKLALQGKTAEANKIKTELGLGLHNGSGQGTGYGRNR
jgi:hypothetical protein